MSARGPARQLVGYRDVRRSSSAARRTWKASKLAAAHRSVWALISSTIAQVLGRSAELDRAGDAPPGRSVRALRKERS